MLSPETSGREPWQDRRSRFNHDWLKNRHLNRLDGFLVLLESSGASPDLVQGFLSQDLPEWERRSRDARDLLATFTAEMTPQAGFRHAPLCGVSETSRAWLEPLVHRLWLSRYPVAEWLDRAGAALDQADRDYAVLREQLIDDPAPAAERVAAMKDLFVAFRDACRQVGVAMGRLPHEVLVV
jgi:hypothetical protein